MTGGWRRGLVAAAFAALAGCADRLPVDAAGHHTALPPPAPMHGEPPPPAPAPLPAPSPPPKPADTCGAADLAYLVGKPRTEIPVPVDLTRRRVVCEGCPVTQDFRSDRQNIFFDQATGKVTRLTCG